MPSTNPDPQQVLADLERVWKEALDRRAKGGEPVESGRPNPRLDPSQDFALGMDPDGKPNLVAVEEAPTTDWNKVRAAAIDLLATFVDPARQPDRQVVAIDLVPTREDLQAIFQPEHVDAVEAAYRAAFRTPPMPVARADQTRIILATARPDQLRERSPISDQFPGAYRRLLDRLMPEPVWAAWKFVTPGSAHGMLYDGLVWTGTRWVWIPKPWRLFSDLA